MAVSRRSTRLLAKARLQDRSETVYASRFREPSDERWCLAPTEPSGVGHPPWLIMSGCGTYRTCQGGLTMSVHRGIVLQNSKVAPVQIFGETLKREAIDDSDNLSRATEVAYEFCLRRRGPSDPYTKTASAALRLL